MKRLLILLCLLFAAQPALAQTYADPVTGGPLTWQQNEIIGDGTTPNGGTPPAIAQMGPLPTETYDPSPWIYQTTEGFRQLISDQDQAKVRFTCGPNALKRIDSLKLPGQPEGSSHEHEQFGIKLWIPNLDYDAMRAFAGNPESAKNTCPGGPINDSGYWGNAIGKKQALRAGGKRLVKKPNLVTLYYYLGGGHHWKDFAKFQPLFPGWGEIMGTYMEDPDQVEFRKIASAFAAAHPELQMVVPEGGAHAAFKCETTNGSNADSINPGSDEQPALTNPAKGNRPTLTCPTNETIIRVTVSFTCWNGQLPKPGDAYSHEVPGIRFNVDGKVHCPNHYWLKPTIETQERYSHTGPTDYGTWDCDEVDAMGRANASAKAGYDVGDRGRCFYSHLDYHLGWDVAFLKRWQCRGLGVSLLGATNCYPHDLTANQIDDTTALTQPTGILSNRFTGGKLSDFFVPPPTSGGMRGMVGHGPMTH